MPITLQQFFAIRPDAVLSIDGSEGWNFIAVDGEPYIVSKDGLSKLPGNVNIEDKKAYFRLITGSWWCLSDEAISQINEVEIDLLAKEELSFLTKTLTIARAHDPDNGKVMYPAIRLKRIIDPILTTPNMGQVVCYYAGKFGYSVLTTPSGVKYVEKVEMEFWRLRDFTDEEIKANMTPELQALLNP